MLRRLLAEAAPGICTSTSFRPCWGASHALHRELEVVRRDPGIKLSGGGGVDVDNLCFSGDVNR